MPIWISLLQALVIPFVAIVGALIAFQQMCIARQKLEMDAFSRLYEQRKQVCEATREILPKVYKEPLSRDDIRSYGLKVLDAEFLFDAKISEYPKLLRHYVEQWHYGNENAETTSRDERRI